MSESYAPSRRPPSTDAVASRERGHVAVDHEFARGLMENVNHHLRTPLTVVLGHAELLIDREHELPPEVRQSLASLRRAAQRLNDVVVGVCDLMDIAGVGPHTLDSVDVSALVAEEVATHQERAAQRGIRLLVGGDPAQQCIADSRRLRRALRELLENALTYAPDQSTVRVASSASATGVRITVSDHGDGIDSDDRERLARPFERGTHPRPGTGAAWSCRTDSVEASKPVSSSR